jgi:hypothetical protein
MEFSTQVWFAKKFFPHLCLPHAILLVNELLILDGKTTERFNSIQIFQK